MVNILDTREVGDTIRFESEVYNTTPFDTDETLTDADSITITIEKRDGTKVVDGASLLEHAKGQYYYEWDTQGLEKTDYKIEIKAVQGDTEEVSCGYVRLKECTE